MFGNDTDKSKLRAWRHYEQIELGEFPLLFHPDLSSPNLLSENIRLRCDGGSDGRLEKIAYVYSFFSVLFNDVVSS
jgi:hypothetical protein